MMAIHSGVPKAAAAVLDNMGECEAIKQLTTEHNAYRHKEWVFPDGTSIQGKISALLYAAASGSSAVFSAVLKIMRDKLGPGQVVLIIACCNRS